MNESVKNSLLRKTIVYNHSERDSVLSEHLDGRKKSMDGGYSRPFVVLLYGGVS